jgi:citrate synthase
MNLIAKLPSLAAMIYRHKYKNNDLISVNKEFDWAGNYAHMLGYDSYEIRECLRGKLYIILYITLI